MYASLLRHDIQRNDTKYIVLNVIYAERSK
jgi:hypothetical protein